MKDLPSLKLTVATKEIRGGGRGAENAIFLNFIHNFIHKHVPYISQGPDSLSTLQIRYAPQAVRTSQVYEEARKENSQSHHFQANKQFHPKMEAE